MSDLFHLGCPVCRRRFSGEATTICPACFYPTSITYDLDAVRQRISHEAVQARPRDIWRYQELLPVTPGAGGLAGVGWTPLIPAPRLGRKLGSGDVLLKDDAACFPTLSFKDRVVAVALAAARELGYGVVGCASTGNLANAVAAQAARAGLTSWILVPADLEAAKLLGTAVYGAHLVRIAGTYDQVNRLCLEISDRHRWGFVNVNLRPFYAEGSKTVAFEIAEQLGWRLPDNVVVPMAGGSQLTRIARGFQELVDVGLVPAHPVRIFGAQAKGCSPIVTAFLEGSRQVVPQVPQTICRSLAIGDPADGYTALEAMTSSGGGAGLASDPEIRQGIRILAESEGILGETAAGVTVAVAGRLLAEGRIGAGDTTVLCITGNGLKTLECLDGHLDLGAPLDPSMAAFEARHAQLAGAA